MAEKIIKSVVDDLTATDGDKLEWDTEIKGFGVRARKSGKKYYVLKYRFLGSQKWLTIGQHGSPWTAEKARKEAKRLLGVLAADKDPAQVRDERKLDIKMSALCDEYLEKAESGEILTKDGASKKASTLATDRGRIIRHIKPLLGRRPVASITQMHMKRFLHDVASGKTAADVKTGKRGRAIVKGGTGTATRTLGLLGGIFSYAIEIGLRTDNPVRGVKRFKDSKNERYLSAKELNRLGDVLAEIDEDGSELPAVVTALRLLILTGARKSEIVTARWEYVDFDHGMLRLPDSKTGAKIILLGAPALGVLSATKKEHENPYICPGVKEGMPIAGLQKAWVKIRNRAKLPNVRIHDLRHSFASAAAAGGDSLLMIGALLGHKDQKTTQRYAHLADDPKKAAADRTAKRLASMLDGNMADVASLNRQVSKNG